MEIISLKYIQEFVLSYKLLIYTAIFTFFLDNELAAIFSICLLLHEFNLYTQHKVSK